MCHSDSVSRENLQWLEEGSYPTGSPGQCLQDRTGHLSQSHALPGSAQPVAEGGVPRVGRLPWLPLPHGSSLRWPRLSQNCSTISGSPDSVTGGRPPHVLQVFLANPSLPSCILQRGQPCPPTSSSSLASTSRRLTPAHTTW